MAEGDGEQGGVGQQWHMVQCRMMLDFRQRPTDMLVPEELEEVRRAFGEWLDERYGEHNVDLCFVTHEGMYDEDNDPHPDGWGFSAEEMWEKIPGDTPEEKRQAVEEAMRGVEPEDL